MKRMLLLTRSLAWPVQDKFYEACCAKTITEKHNSSRILAWSSSGSMQGCRHSDRNASGGAFAETCAWLALLAQGCRADADWTVSLGASGSANIAWQTVESSVGPSKVCAQGCHALPDGAAIPELCEEGTAQEVGVLAAAGHHICRERKLLKAKV